MPSGPGIRVDAAIEAGERVPPDYDPLIAKIMAHGRDRPEAIARLRRALGEVEVTGIQTTLPFHRAVVADPQFAAGRLSTEWVGERWDGAADRRERLELAQLAAGLAIIDGWPSLEDGSGGRTTGADGQRPDWRRAGREAMLERWPR